MEETLSRKARMRLALKIAEPTLYPLATPWFFSLNSTNLRQLESTRAGHLPFMLRTPASELQDLLSDDPAALDETAQLFRRRSLLIEMALEGEADLEKKEDSVMLDHHVRARGGLHQLPHVEGVTGLQYCTATAFCLHYGEGEFSGPEKYQGKVYGAWELYSAEMLKDPHPQGFLS